MKQILVTGAAGFIGSKVSEILLKEEYEVIGIDNLNDYYDVNLKLWRLNNLKKYSNFKFYKIDIENYDGLKPIFQLEYYDAVINLAARAGVRYSLENPFIYLSTNAGGNLNLLELCREYNVSKFVLASTSSLYAGQEIPFKEDLSVNTPISPYAASKKAAESMAVDLEFESKVFFLGIRRDITSLMSAADIFVLSSAFEGFGLVVAEAMACERMVVANVCGGVREVVGDCGTLVPPCNDKELANAILQSLDCNEDERKEIGHNARRQIVDFYSLESTVARWLKIYCMGSD